jgi:hypothetical protein
MKLCSRRIRDPPQQDTFDSVPKRQKLSADSATKSKSNTDKKKEMKTNDVISLTNNDEVLREHYFINCDKCHSMLQHKEGDTTYTFPTFHNKDWDTLYEKHDMLHTSHTTILIQYTIHHYHPIKYYIWNRVSLFEKGNQSAGDDHVIAAKRQKPGAYRPQGASLLHHDPIANCTTRRDI